MNVNRLFSVLLTLALITLGFASPVYAAGSDTDIEIDGTIKATYLKEDGTGWIKVDGIKVIIDGDTDVDGMLMVGAEVEIDGDLLKLLAGDIEVRDEPEDIEVRGRGDGTAEVRGTITMLHLVEGYKFIKVDGIKVLIGEDTGIDGMLTEGAGVRLEGDILKVLAREIDVEKD
ncbi:MAG: DUF5666 domain-containing protein [Dehalococcoidales bacterium]|nr:DUF5666 domain-containing protein [Dehalococcoidales bacterium]